MIAGINSWAQKIIIVVVISTIIEMILPNGKNKKYIKTVMGIYIIFVIIQPIILGITGNNVNLNTVVEATYKSANIEKIEPSFDTNKYVEQTYKEKILEDIEERLNQRNYNVQNLTVEIETENEEEYGEILSIYAEVSKINKLKEKTNTIEAVNVSIGGNNQEIEDIISEEEKENLVNYLKEIYYTDNIKVI